MGFTWRDGSESISMRTLKMHMRKSLMMHMRRSLRMIIKFRLIYLSNGKALSEEMILALAAAERNIKSAAENYNNVARVILALYFTEQKI